MQALKTEQSNPFNIQNFSSFIVIGVGVEKYYFGGANMYYGIVDNPMKSCVFVCANLLLLFCGLCIAVAYISNL